MQNHSTARWDAELVALRDEIYAEGGCTIREAAEMARNSIGMLADYAAGWDAYADELLMIAYAPCLAEELPAAPAITRYSQVLSKPGQTFTYQMVELCPACASKRSGLSKVSSVYNGSCEQCEAQPEPTPITMTAAQRKAAYNAAQGVKPVPSKNGYLVPSSSRGAVIHFVGADGRCTCEAGQSGKACWHVALVALDQAA